MPPSLSFTLLHKWLGCRGSPPTPRDGLKAPDYCGARVSFTHAKADLHSLTYDYKVTCRTKTEAREYKSHEMHMCLLSLLSFFPRGQWSHPCAELHSSLSASPIGHHWQLSNPPLRRLLPHSLIAGNDRAPLAQKA